MRALAKAATPAAIALLRQATAAWPQRNRASDGLLPSAAHVKQNPDSSHNDGFAVDLTHDKVGGVDCNELFLKLREDPRVEYLIFQGKIWSKAKGERAYSGSNPHNKHMHVDIKRDGKAHLDTSPWFPWVKPTVTGKVKAAVQRPAKKK